MQADEIAKSVDHADDAQAGEQEYQCVTEAQAVIDGAKQHGDEYDTV